MSGTGLGLAIAKQVLDRHGQDITVEIPSAGSADITVNGLSNYEYYAGQAGVSDCWCDRIKEEIGYRVENML